MLYIQDPSYENSKYLHESLLSECIDSNKGAGAYAFATKDGINLLLKDENFKHFLKNGTYTLVVGTDDITNEHSITTLMELKKYYGDNLNVKVYVHNGKGSTFHPKFSWFKKSNGGSLVLGSGNLTQKGLRQNREAYTVVQHDDKGIESIIEEWEKWYKHCEPFLFDIDNPVVMIKAKMNGEKTIAISKAKSEVTKKNAAKKTDNGLTDIYKGQPKDQKFPKVPKNTESESGHIQKNAPIDLLDTDEDIDVDVSYWTISEKSKILIAEIPKSGNRWKQANFDKNTFEYYFGATCGENGEYRVLLKNVNADGRMSETEVRPSVSVLSQNYRFELEAANGLEYPEGNERPIAIFAKVSHRDFIYTLLMPGQDNYREIMGFIGEKISPSNKMRRIQYVAKEVFERVPNLSLWSRLEKEEEA